MDNASFVSKILGLGIWIWEERPMWANNFKSQYVVYAIFCPCRLIYIGKTIHHLYVRFREHVKSTALSEGVQRIIQHVREAHDGGFQNIKIC